MNKWKLYSPEGMQDLLGENCYRKREAEARLRQLYLMEGYREIETPLFEYYDVFSSAESEAAARSMYKTVDEKGRMLVARPEMTVPAARVAATKMSDGCMPIRIFYNGKCIRSDDVGGGKQREFTQSGVEILGSEDVFYDAVAIATAAQALKTIGLGEFIIEIGQVDFFKRLMEMAGFSEEDSEEIRLRIDSKDFFGVEEILAGKDIAGDAKKLILELPHLYGKREMLEDVKSRVSDQKLSGSIDRLLEVLDILEDLDAGDYFTVDLGMVKRLDYYTGIIFKGMTYGMGFPVLGGGRYDNLCDDFDRPMAATGFSLGLDLALAALYRTGDASTSGHVPDVTVCFTKAGRAEGAKAAQALRKQGLKVELMPAGESIGDDKILYCENSGIGGIVFAKGDGEIEVLDMKNKTTTGTVLEELKGGTI